MKETRFKDTEIGRIPEDWNVETLGANAEIFRGGSPRPIEDYITELPFGINWIKIGDVKPGDKYIRKTAEKIIPSGASKSRSVEPGDFILSNSMSFGRPYILAIDGCIHDGWLVIKNYQKTFDKEFLYYVLGSSAIVNQYKSMAAGSSVQNLNKDKVAGVNVIFPLSQEEQSRIASALTSIDNLISSLDKLIEKKKNIKQGTMQQLLTGKKRLKGFTEPWEEKKIDKVCDYISDFTAAGSFENIANNVVYSKKISYAQLIRTVDLKSKFANKDSFIFVNEHAFKYLWRVNLDTEALVMPNVGNCGEVYYITPSLFPYKNNVLGPNAILVKSKSENVKFLYYFFQGKDFQDVLSGIIAPSGQTKFNKTAFKELNIRIPRIEEQIAIAALLTSIDNEISALESKKAKYESMKQGMMQQLLTGKIRLID